MPETGQSIRQDHALLRKKLALLESAIQAGPEARGTLREMCESLRRLLREHIGREVEALERHRKSQQAPAPPALVYDHADVEHLLRSVNDLLASGMRAALPLVLPRVAEVIEKLQTQMDEQERTLLPVIEPRIAAPISGAMSVNEILRRYPETEPVFEHLHVNRIQEGYESVDEVAWYHGLDASQLVDELREAAARAEARDITSTAAPGS